MAPVECGKSSTPGRIVEVIAQPVKSPVSSRCALQRRQEIGTVLEQSSFVSIQKWQLVLNFVRRQSVSKQIFKCNRQHEYQIKRDETQLFCKRKCVQTF